MSIRQRLLARIHQNVVRRFRWNVRRNRFFSEGFFHWQRDCAGKLDDPRARAHPIGARLWHAD
jgi:hypothetical protein